MKKFLIIWSSWRLLDLFELSLGKLYTEIMFEIVNDWNSILQLGILGTVAQGLSSFIGNLVYETASSLWSIIYKSDLIITT